MDQRNVFGILSAKVLELTNTKYKVEDDLVCIGFLKLTKYKVG